MIPRGSQPPLSSPTSLRSALAGIDAELAALRARVEELAVARKPIVDALNSIVYPILTIPVEITAEIFLRCVDWAEISAGQPGSLCAPLVLASVCKQWRAVALDLQPIWSRLQIVTVDFHRISRLEGLLVWWVPPAGGQLLEVDMTESDSRVIAVLIPHSTRWRSLTCDFSSRLRYPTGLADIQGRIPNLERLRFDLTSGLVPTEMRSIFSEAPLLREVHVTGEPYAFRSFILPWGQLTTLGLGRDGAAAYSDILERTPQLQILHLERGAFDFEVPETTLTLHHLHTLKLHGDDGCQVHDSALLDPLVLPALRHLDLGVFSDEFVDELFALLTRSSCSLASMSLRSPSLDLQTIILDEVWTPTEIHLTDLAWTPQQFDTFFVRMHSSLGVLPNLRNLSMSSRLVDVPYAAMAKMVASRQGAEEGCARLESFRFTLPQPTPVDDEVFAMFETLTAQGCRVEIQGLKGFNMGFDANSSASHSYTLESPSHMF
ncbi:hypothetical protein C8R46DRAFT_1108411 [Mycena filopes]|nr:hypothetical protein C8R46DRAFT_1108411 [Mycena filopes]